MLCLQNENINGKEVTKDKALSEAPKRRKRSPEEAVCFYGDDCVLIIATEDYQRTTPSFLNLHDALEEVYLAVEDEKIEEAFLLDITNTPTARVLTFENGASFMISPTAYDALQNEFGSNCEMAYSCVVRYMFNHFA